MLNNIVLPGDNAHTVPIFFAFVESELSRVVPHPITKWSHWGLVSQFGTGCGALPKVWPLPEVWSWKASYDLEARCDL